MKRLLGALAVVGLTGCGAHYAQAVRSCGPEDVVCVDTGVGTFATRASHLTELQDVLAGEPSEHPHHAQKPAAASHAFDASFTDLESR